MVCDRGCCKFTKNKKKTKTKSQEREFGCNAVTLTSSLLQKIGFEKWEVDCDPAISTSF